MRKLMTFLCAVLGAVSLSAQISVSGTVTAAEDGSPLAGATVYEKGTTNGTFTDENGKYTLKIAGSESIVVFRLQGYSTIEQIGGGDVSLQTDALMLDDVVVTALGISREKRSLGYATQTVGGGELLKARDGNLVNNLSGRIAGVNVVGSSGNVGASSRIVIRGNNSVSGNNEPLWVIDGVPVNNNTNNTTSGGENVDYGNVIADLNPEDIESITVLKGANAAALYGTRAKNGVIVVTTKKGTGPARKGVGVSYSFNIGLSNPLRLPTYQNKFGQGSGGQFGYYDGNYGGSWDGYDESWGPSFDAAINENDSIDNDLDGQIDEAGEGGSLPQFTGDWGVHDNDGFDNNYDGTVDEAGEEGYSAEPWLARPDNIKGLFQTGISLTNSVALEARTANSYARLSYTNTTQTGMVPNTDYKKNAFDINFGGKLSERLSMDGNVKYIRTESDNRPGVGYAGDNILQQSIWVGRQVDWENLEQNWETVDNWGNNYNWNHSYQNNPYFTLYNNIKPMDRDRVMGFFNVNYKFTDWLSVRGRIGTDFYRENRKRIFAIGTKDHPRGELEEDNINFQETNSELMVRINKRFGEKIDFSANLGGNRMYQTNKFNTILAPALTVPGVYNISNSNGSPIVRDRSSRKAINSIFAMVSVGYDGFLYLDLTGRNDWSSTLPSDNWSYFYPSASLSLLVNELADLPEVFDLLKIRGGWAQVGGDADPYQLQTVYTTVDPWAGIPAFTVPNLLPNSNLLPQSQNSWETGLELIMLKNRLSFDFTYYNQLTKNQLMNIDIAPSTGATQWSTNSGSIRNSGVEIMAQGVAVKTKDFSWTVGLNFAKNKSMVVELADGVEAIRLGRYWGLDLEARVGEPFGTFRGLKALTDDEGNLILDGGLPQIDPKSKEYSLGTITPDWTGGLSNTFSFKGITLSTLIDVRKGSDLFSVTYMFGRYAGVLEESLEGRETVDDIMNGHVYPGMMYDADSNLVANNVPMDAETWNAFIYPPLGGHDRSIFDASFVKLREISLTYKIPQSLIGNTILGGLEVGAYGRNLALLYSNVPHVDPESAFGSQLNVQGFEFGALPSARTFGFTLNAIF